MCLLAPSLAAPQDDLDAGDRAWCRNDRQEAAIRWRAAANAPNASPDVIAMAEVRLLQVSSNLSVAVHGPRADRALSQCPGQRPECALARADYALILARLGLPSGEPEPEIWIALAARSMPGRAQARRVLAKRDEANTLSARTDLDGMGEGLRDAGEWPTGPPTPVIGLGLSGAPGLGVGGSIQYVDSDLLWRGWRLDATLAATTRRIGAAAIHLRTDRAMLGASVGRLVLDNYRRGVTQTVWTAEAEIAARRGPVWLGPMIRWDDGRPGHGLTGGWRDQWAPVSASVLVEASFWRYQHVRADVDVVLDVPVTDRGRLAARALGAASPGSEAPWWRRPVVGGGRVLRGAPAYRWRGDLLLAGVLEWRQQLWGPLGGVVFAEGAWIEDGLRPGGGLGLRLHLPPQPLNTARLDVGAGAEGLTITVGWQEAF
ncbi:MAG: hypothetical protein AAFV53_12875 [Myxococcota bacterium]